MKVVRFVEEVFRSFRHFVFGFLNDVMVQEFLEFVVIHCFIGEKFIESRFPIFRQNYYQYLAVFLLLDPQGLHFLMIH